jgi:hypothetical protein
MLRFLSCVQTLLPLTPPPPLLLLALKLPCRLAAAADALSVMFNTGLLLLKTKGISELEEKVSVELKKGRTAEGWMRVNWEKGHQGSGDSEASQRSTATFQNRAREWEGAWGCMQGR